MIAFIGYTFGALRRPTAQFISRDAAVGAVLAAFCAITAAPASQA